MSIDVHLLGKDPRYTCLALEEIDNWENYYLGALLSYGHPVTEGKGAVIRSLEAGVISVDLLLA